MMKSNRSYIKNNTKINKTYILSPTNKYYIGKTFYYMGDKISLIAPKQ